MRRTLFGLLVAGLLAAPAGAADSAAAPGLVRLEHALTLAQRDHEQGRISPAAYERFLAGFRADLAAAKAEASPTPENAAIHARILDRLGELKLAGDALGAALQINPGAIALRTALSQIRYDEKNFPAALAEADAALALDPANKEALALKHFSMGRVAMNVEAASDSPAPARTPQFSALRLHFRAVVPHTLPFILPFKMSRAAAPPDLVAHESAPEAPGPFPLVPLAEAATLGLAAFAISRSRSTCESSDGLDDEHPKPVGRYQRLVAGAILAGALGGVIYTAGAAVVSAAPIVLGYASIPGSVEKTEETIPQAEAVAAKAEEIVIKKGDILNRVWHSDWTPNSTHSGPEGFSYCRGACLPIHAAEAIDGRGLTMGVINNGRQGGLYRATEDIVATIRQAIGGYEEEVLLRSPEDIKKLEPIRESFSSIPHRL